MSSGIRVPINRGKVVSSIESPINARKPNSPKSAPGNAAESGRRRLHQCPQRESAPAVGEAGWRVQRCP
jgi:hypothetical protein